MKVITIVRDALLSTLRRVPLFRTDPPIYSWTLHYGDTEPPWSERNQAKFGPHTDRLVGPWWE